MSTGGKLIVSGVVEFRLYKTHFSFSVRILFFWLRGVRGGVKQPRFRFGFLSGLRPYWCFRAFLLCGIPSFFCHDVYLICADATPKVRILGHRGRARGGLGVAKAKDRSPLPVSLEKRKKKKPPGLTEGASHVKHNERCQGVTRP